MTKRIVSGVFLLIALGALGLILAGALTSGEQLIVRFLTAIVVAALCLYVISDLRLEADEKSASKSSARTSAAEGTRRRAAQSAPLPPNSTAAFMATVTGKRSTTTAAAGEANNPDGTEGDRTASEESDRDPAKTGAAEVGGAELGVADEDEGGDEPEDGGVAPVLDGPSPATGTPAGYPEEPVEAAAWPQTPDGHAVTDDEQPSDGLVAIFSKQRQRDECEADQEQEVIDHPLVVNDFHRPPPMPVVTGPTLTSIDGGAGVLLPAGDATGSSARGQSSNEAPTDGASTSDDEETAADDLVAMADPHANPEPVTVSVGSGSAPLLGEPHLNPEPAATTGSTKALPTTDDVPGAVILTVSAPQPMSSSMPASAIGKDPSPEVEAAAYARARVLSLLAGETGSADIDAAIRSGELEIISSLVDDETLSSEGPISDSDVRTMVFVAFTSNELRKILLSGGRLDVELDDIELEDLDLGPVEVFPTAAAAARSVAAAALPTPGNTLAATCVDGVAAETSTDREQAVAAS